MGFSWAFSPVALTGSASFLPALNLAVMNVFFLQALSSEVWVSPQVSFWRRGAWPGAPSSCVQPCGSVAGLRVGNPDCQAPPEPCVAPAVSWGSLGFPRGPRGCVGKGDRPLHGCVTCLFSTPMGTWRWCGCCAPGGLRVGRSGGWETSAGVMPRADREEDCSAPSRVLGVRVLSHCILAVHRRCYCPDAPCCGHRRPPGPSPTYVCEPQCPLL